MTSACSDIARIMLALHSYLKFSVKAGAVFGETGVMFERRLAGAPSIFGDVGVSLFVASAVFVEVGRSDVRAPLFVGVL